VSGEEKRIKMKLRLLHEPNGLLSLLILPLLSCGGSSSSSPGAVLNPTPVQAQTTYSAASLSGTYTITMIAGEAADIVPPVTFIGSLSLDGNGNITAGTINGATTTFGTTNSPGTTTSSPLTATGKYTLSSNATGTASLMLVGSSVSTISNASNGPVSGCFQVPSQLSFNLAAAQQGDSFVFQMAPGSSNVNFSGSAFKQ
jgi:hypothetical protein